MGLLAALQFLTILPVKRSFTPAQIGRAAVFFPLVGIFIGAILLGLDELFNLILPPGIVNVLLVVSLVILSGGLHLDGLADTMDGMGGHRTPAERLEIMRDSRIGGFGAIAIALILLVLYVTLNSIPHPLRWSVLLVFPTLSRWAMVNAIFVYPYARPSGLGKAFKEGLNWPQYALATVLTIIVTIVLFRLSGLVMLAATWAAATLTSLYLKRKLNGLTGDTYGAINEITAVSVLIVINILAFKHFLIM